MAAPIKVVCAPSQKTEQQVYDTVNTVALDYATNFFWSSWHSWNEISKGNTDPTPAFWDGCRPFGSCLGASTHIFYAARAALAQHPDADVAKHADTVQLMTSAQHATTDTQYHGVVALCFDTLAIVVDHSSNSTAFKVPLGGEYAMEPYVPLFGARDQERFNYFQAEDGSYMLTMNSVGKSYPALLFAEMDVEASVRQLAIPAAKAVAPLKDRPEISLPPRKYVSVRSLMDEEPQLIASVPVDNKFLATTLRVQADFGHPALLMQVPRADWLNTPKGCAWVNKQTLHLGFEMKCDASVRVKVDLSAEHNAEMTTFEYELLEVMASLGNEFGLDRRVIFDLAESIFQVWAPYRVDDNSDRVNSTCDCLDRNISTQAHHCFTMTQCVESIS